MDEVKQKPNEEGEKDILFSKAIKAGKRIYYIDVKKDKNDDLYLSITESKKIIRADAQRPNFEKHKIFLYKEDFDKFQNGLDEALRYAKGELTESPDKPELAEGELKFDIDF